MNIVYFMIALPFNNFIPIAIDNSKLHGDASVMWEAEQQGLLTYEQTNTTDWSVYRISPSQYNDVMASR